MTFTPGFHVLPQINSGGALACRACGGTVHFRGGQCIRCLLREGLTYAEEVDPYCLRSRINEGDPSDGT